jgi:hypothetical protein
MTAEEKNGKKPVTHEKDDHDVYDYAYRLKNAISLTERSTKILPADKKLVNDFLNHLEAKRVSNGRLAKYCHTVRKARREPRRPAGVGHEERHRGALNLDTEAGIHAPHSLGLSPKSTTT